MKKRLFALLLVCVMTLGLAACNSSAGPSQPDSPAQSGSPSQADSPSAPSEGGTQGESTITIAMNADWDGWNVTTAVSQYNCLVNDLIFDRLANPHADGSYTPRLADSWESADDYMSVIFHLNENAKWHDGEPVTADDVVWSISYWTDPAGASKMSSFFNFVTGTDSSGYQVEGETLGVEALDAHTVKISLKNQKTTTSVLDDCNRYFWVLPSHILSQYTTEELSDATLWSNPVGSGPYKYVAELENNQLEVTRNEDYHRGCPNINNIVVKVVEASSLVASLQSGDISLVSGFGISVAVTDWPTIQSIEGYTTVSIPTNSFQAMFMNEECEKLADPRVRQAINYAINRQAIVDNILGGQGCVEYSLIPRNHPFYNDEIEVQEYNPEKAKELLAEAGWDPNTVLYLSVSTGAKLQTPMMIQQDLAAVGITVEFDLQEFNTLLLGMKNGEFEMGMMGASGSVSPYTQAYFLIGGHPNNFSNITDERIGNLINEANKTLDPDKEHELWDEALVLANENAPAVFLYTNNYLCAYDSRIGNLETSVWPYVSLGSVWEWTWNE